VTIGAISTIATLTLVGGCAYFFGGILWAMHGPNKSKR
jgi:hypothetical protein